LVEFDRAVPPLGLSFLIDVTADPNTGEAMSGQDGLAAGARESFVRIFRALDADLVILRQVPPRTSKMPAVW
jgi:hypothetical protein